MSYRIETLNKGTIENFGFLGPDVSKIRLGEMPAIDFEDFCNWSTNTLIVALETADHDLKKEIETIVAGTHGKIKDLSVREDPLDFRTETRRALAEALEKLPDNHVMKVPFEQMIEELDRSQDSWETAQHYDSNPFSIEGGHIVIGNTYKLTLREFAYFSTYVMAGGWFGWDERGIPRPARESIDKLQDCLKIFA